MCDMVSLLWQPKLNSLTRTQVLLESMLGALHLNMAGVVETHDRQKQIEKKLASLNPKP